MSRQKQNTEQKSKDINREKANEYSLDELLSKSLADAFWQNAEDKQWLNGPLIEK
jgi:hypothetical protein